MKERYKHSSRQTDTDTQMKGRTYSGHTTQTERRRHRRRVEQTGRHATHQWGILATQTLHKTDIQTKGEKQTEGRLAHRRRCESKAQNTDKKTHR